MIRQIVILKNFVLFDFLFQGTFSFAFTIFPCAGGTENGNGQLENQVDMLIHTCTCNASIYI